MKVASISSFIALVLFGAAVQHTQAEDDTCNLTVVNLAYDGLTVSSFNQYDGSCFVDYESIIMNNEGATSQLSCQGSYCQVKVDGANNCDGTADVPCGKYLLYYYNKNGALTYCISDTDSLEHCSTRRQLVQEDQTPEQPPKAAAQRMLRSTH